MDAKYFQQAYKPQVAEQEDRLEEAVRYFQRAYALQMRGQLEEAIDLYQKSIETYPTAEAHTFLGWTYSFMNRIDDAIEECYKAIEVDPDFGNPYNDIGAYLIEKGDWRGAIPWLEKAMVAKRYECYFYPYFNLGRIWEAQGKYLEAMRCYQRALEKNPKYNVARRAIRRLQCILN